VVNFHGGSSQHRITSTRNACKPNSVGAVLTPGAVVGGFAANTELAVAKLVIQLSVFTNVFRERGELLWNGNLTFD
jgi:hypothetical protein